MADHFAEDTASLLGGGSDESAIAVAQPAPHSLGSGVRASTVAKAAAFAAVLLAGAACVVVTRGHSAGADSSTPQSLRGPRAADDRALVMLAREQPAKADAQALVTLAEKADTRTLVTLAEKADTRTLVTLAEKADTRTLVTLAEKADPKASVVLNEKKTKDDDGSKGKHKGKGHDKDQAKPKLVQQTFDADKDNHGEVSVEAGEWVYPLPGSESKNGWTFIYTGKKQGYVPDWALEEPKADVHPEEAKHGKAGGDKDDKGKHVGGKDRKHHK